MPDPDTQLVRQAEGRIPDDPDVRDCWGLIRRGLEVGWLDRAEIGELIEHLRERRDFGVEELLFAHSGDRLRISFLDDTATCSPGAMMEELAALLALGSDGRT